MKNPRTAARRGTTILSIALASLLLLSACGDDTPAATTTSYVHMG